MYKNTTHFLKKQLLSARLMHTLKTRLRHRGSITFNTYNYFLASVAGGIPNVTFLCHRLKIVEMLNIFTHAEKIFRCYLSNGCIYVTKRFSPSDAHIIFLYHTSISHKLINVLSCRTKWLCFFLLDERHTPHITRTQARSHSLLSLSPSLSLFLAVNIKQKRFTRKLIKDLYQDLPWLHYFIKLI